MEFFDGMDSLLKTFWFIAIPTSLIFAVITLLTFLGADASDGVDADFDGDLTSGDTPFQLFSLRNFINFLLGFSWTGISFFTTIPNQTLLLALALAVGISFVLFFFWVMKQVQKLAENNSFTLGEALNKTAEVYLTIPEKKAGKGKIMISVKGAFHELEAMTEKDRIPSGAMVKVVGLEHNILLVEPL